MFWNTVCEQLWNITLILTYQLYFYLKYFSWSHNIAICPQKHSGFPYESFEFHFFFQVN